MRCRQLRLQRLGRGSGCATQGCAAGLERTVQLFRPPQAMVRCCTALAAAAACVLAAMLRRAVVLRGCPQVVAVVAGRAMRGVDAVGAEGGVANRDSASSAMHIACLGDGSGGQNAASVPSRE